MMTGKTALRMVIPALKSMLTEVSGLSARISAVVAFATIAAGPAAAVIVTPQRAQIVVVPGAHTAIPAELQVHSGDLISVWASDKAELKFIAKSDAGAIISPLNKERYEALSREGGGQPSSHGFPEVRGSSWKRFGAAGPGVAYLRVRDKGREHVLRFQVVAREEPARGGTVRANENDQRRLISLSWYDTLTIELPGTPGSGWRMNPASGSGLELVTISAVASLQRSLLTFKLLHEKDGPAERSFDLFNGEQTYRFVWQERPAPLAK